jgi:hypothetical protein
MKANKRETTDVDNEVHPSTSRAMSLDLLQLECRSSIFLLQSELSKLSYIQGLWLFISSTLWLSIAKHSLLSSPPFNMAHIRNIYSFSLLTLQLRALITRSTIVGSDYKEGKTRSLKVGSSTILGSKMEKSQNYPKTFQPCP